MKRTLASLISSGLKVWRPLVEVYIDLEDNYIKHVEIDLKRIFFFDSLILRRYDWAWMRENLSSGSANS